LGYQGELVSAKIVKKMKKVREAIDLYGVMNPGEIFPRRTAFMV